MSIEQDYHSLWDMYRKLEDKWIAVSQENEVLKGQLIEAHLEIIKLNEYIQYMDSIELSAGGTQW